MSLSHFTLSFAMISKACEQAPKKGISSPKMTFSPACGFRRFSSAKDAVGSSTVPLLSSTGSTVSPGTDTAQYKVEKGSCFFHNTFPFV